MNHQVLVYVLHCRANLAEQPYALADLQSVALAVLVNTSALHIIHHEIWQSLLGRAAVEQLGDVAMIEGSQDLAFMPEAVNNFTGINAGLYKFDRNPLVESVVGPDSEIHRSHAAGTNLADDAIGAKRLSLVVVIFM